MEGPSHGLSGPVKVYENGVARKSPKGECSFLPWGTHDRYCSSEVRGLGNVLTVPIGLHSIEFLASMRDYHVVEGVIWGKRAPDIKLSVWGPGRSS